MTASTNSQAAGDNQSDEDLSTPPRGARCLHRARCAPA